MTSPPDDMSGVVDAIVLELIQTRLTSVVREMRSIMIRTARSPMIHEGHDFSCAVLSPASELVAASEVEQPTHLSALPWSARSVLARYEGDIGPGDLFLHNDPYTGGAHLNDVALYSPVFTGDILIAHLGIMAHWQDVGGMVPGSFSGTATEVFQEGVRIPIVSWAISRVRPTSPPSADRIPAGVGTSCTWSFQPAAPAPSSAPTATTPCATSPKATSRPSSRSRRSRPRARCASRARRCAGTRVAPVAAAAERSRLAGTRMRLRVHGTAEPEFDGTRRVVIVHPATATTLRARSGALVELPNPDGPSLRA